MAKEEKVTRQERQKWQNLTDLLQYGTLALLLFSVIMLNQVNKRTAHEVIWYVAGTLFVLATAGFIVGNISIKKDKTYFKQEFESIKKRHNI